MSDKIRIGFWVASAVLALVLAGREKDRGCPWIVRVLLGILGTPIALVLFLYSRKRIKPIICLLIPWAIWYGLSTAMVLGTVQLDASVMERRMSGLVLSQADGDYAVSCGLGQSNYGGKYIPRERKTWDPEDVGYILRYTSQATSASYTGGVKATGQWLSVTLVDADTDRIIATEYFETVFPMFIDGNKHYTVDEEDVQEWLLTVLPEPPEGQRTSPTEKVTELFGVLIRIGCLLLAGLLLLILGLARWRERAPVSRTKELRIRGQVDFSLLPQLIYKAPAEFLRGLDREGTDFLAGIYNDIFSQTEKLSGEKLPRYTGKQLRIGNLVDVTYVELPKAETETERYAQAVAVVLIRERVFYYALERNARGVLRVGFVDEKGGYSDLGAAERDRLKQVVQLRELTWAMLRKEADEEQARRSAKRWGEEW